MKKLITFIFAGSLFLSNMCGSAFAEETEAEKYDKLIGYLDAGDYDAALDYIRQLKVDSLEGNAADYLVEVELTEENFDEYFEFAAENMLNSFGEPKETTIIPGLISKKFDEGLVVYAMDDIPIELYSAEDDSTLTSTLTSFLRFTAATFTGWSEIGDYQLKRLNSGTVTFVPKEYVALSVENVTPEGRCTLRIEELTPDGSKTIEVRPVYLEHFY